MVDLKGNEIPQNWLDYANRLIEIHQDPNPTDIPEFQLHAYMATLSIWAAEKPIGTRKVEHLRAMLAQMGFENRACLAQFREYVYEEQRKTGTRRWIYQDLEYKGWFECQCCMMKVIGPEEVKWMPISAHGHCYEEEMGDVDFWAIAEDQAREIWEEYEGFILRQDLSS